MESHPINSRLNNTKPTGKRQVIALVTIDRFLSDLVEQFFNEDPDFLLFSLRDRPAAGWNGNEMRTAVFVFDTENTAVDVFNAIKELKRSKLKRRVAVLCGRHRDIVIDQSLRLDVDAVFSRSESIDEFMSGLRKVAAGGTWMSKEVTSRLRFDTVENLFKFVSDRPLSQLTMRQLEVLRHLSVGKSTKDVARALHLSEKAIESHKYRIMKKLDVHDRVELARLAIREGLVDP